MSSTKLPFWLAVEESKPVKFSELAHLMAVALHPDEDETFDYAAARLNLEEELPSAVERGELIVRNPSGMGAIKVAMGATLQRTVILPHELGPYLATRGIELRLIPHGSGPILWTLDNAAIAIAEQEQWHGGTRATFLDQMADAARAGALTIRDPQTNLPFRTSKVRTFYELVTPTDVNEWLARQGVDYRWNAGVPAAVDVVYHLPLYERLQPRSEWTGGRLVDTDLVTLSEAAAMASRHAGTDVGTGDFLRASGRGEISMYAVCGRSVVLTATRPTDKPLAIPAGSVPALPLDACKSLSVVGTASWRTLDGFGPAPDFDGALCRFTRWQLPSSEPDLHTSLGDCRVKGHDVHALADAFRGEAAFAKFDPLHERYTDEASHNEYKLAWWDAALNASMWWGLNSVSPQEAALLLCGVNPNKPGATADSLGTVGEPTADDHRVMLRWFTDAANDGGSRTLDQWVNFATRQGLKHHTWIDEWLEASPSKPRSEEAATVPPVKPVQRSQAHEQSILAALAAAGFDPKNLPKAPPGKESPAKQAAKTALRSMSKEVFKKTWQALRDQGEIAGG